MKHFLSVCGASASGKTTISLKLAEQLRALPSKPSVLLLKMDHYYKDLPKLVDTIRSQVNFDHPDSIDIELFEAHVGCLASGHSIEVPEYSFETHRRLDYTRTQESADFIILEGIHILYSENLRNLSDCTIFIDIPDVVALQRRIQRDTKERGRSIEAIKRQFEQTVKPMFDQYIRPKAQYADIVLDGEQPITNSLKKLISSNAFTKLIK
jgi:uridine kinase